MSFRSRSTTTPVAPPRRSNSLTRQSLNSSTTPSSLNRPYSANYGNLSSPLSYQSSSNNFLYGSNQNMNNLRLGGSSYYDSSGLSNGTGRRGSLSTTSALKYPITSLNSSGNASSYVSPYKDKMSTYSPSSYFLKNGSGSGSNAYTSVYKDRYSSPYSPYTSYDNGVTTAGLSINLNGASKPKRDYSVRNNLLSSNNSGHSTSNQSLNQMYANGNSVNSVVANIGRSQSLRDQERKSRTRNRRAAASTASSSSGTQTTSNSTANSSEATGTSSSSAHQRSLSSSSIHSEGYEVRC